MELIGLLGKKIGMTQIVSEQEKEKKIVPVTVVWVGTNVVSQIKRTKKEGYDSFQISFFECSEKSLNKPTMGHLKKNGISFKKHLKEIRKIGLSNKELVVGSQLNVSFLDVGKKIKVSGVTKGKGFSGVIKRYGFSRGRMTHGASPPHRQIGSLCFGRGYGQKIIKGKKMPGHMGNRNVTKMTKVEKIDCERGIVFLRGSVPGPKKSVVVLKQILF